MNIARIALAAAVAAAGLCIAPAVHAQATRTWVSGVGDDVNPCSRTAPCKTFAGAISKTAAGGEINALDPGGYGAVTITKSITIDGGPGMSSILNSLAAGVIINAAATDSVTLRNLSINGAGNGLVGVRILQAGKVTIENTQIFGNGGADPSGRGISDQRTGGGQLFVTNSVVRNNNQSGIVILPSSGSTTIDVTLRNVQLTGNGNAGMAALSGAHVVIADSLISGNRTYGLAIEEAAGDTQVFVSDSWISDSQFGVLIGAGSPSLRLSNVTITHNDVGLTPGAGAISSLGNNKITGNSLGNGPFSFTMVGSQ